MYRFDILISTPKESNKKIGWAAYPTLKEAQKASEVIQSIPRGTHLVEQSFPNVGYKLKQYGGYKTTKIQEY